MVRTSLFRQVLFVDWHGVLSLDVFWASILQSDTHPLRSELEAKLSRILFCQSIWEGWMKGNLSSQDIISELDIRLSHRFRPDFLIRRLLQDCARMRVNLELLNLFRQADPAVPIVLATDNMDCFAQVFKQARASPRRSAKEPGTLAACPTFFADILCSSDFRILKAEDPSGFFGSWLSSRHLDFSDALLIDDRLDNCKAFRRHGGSSIQWKLGHSGLNEIVEPLNGWLQKTQTNRDRFY